MFEAPIDARVLIGDHAIRIVTPSSNRVVDSEAITVQFTVFPRTSPTALVSGTGLQLRLAYPKWNTCISARVEPPPHWPDNIEHREHAMVGSIAPIYRFEESLFFIGICATHCPCPV